MSELEFPELRAKVLLVDDDLDNWGMLATILEQSGAVGVTSRLATKALTFRAPSGYRLSDDERLARQRQRR